MSKIVAKVAAEPGWRACIVEVVEKIDDKRERIAMKLVPIAHWGIKNPVTSFGCHAGLDRMFSMISGFSSAPPVPLDADGNDMSNSIWGVASPDDTDEAMYLKFEEEAARINAGQWVDLVARIQIDPLTFSTRPTTPEGVT